MKKLFKFTAVLLLLIPLAAAQQSRIYRDGGNWTQEITGSLSGARNLRVKVDAGSVRVQGGSQQDISYSIHNRASTSSEEKARHEFDSYRINAYVRGDTAWIVGEWQEGRPQKFSGEFVIQVPRNLEALKMETEGGSVTANGIAGHVDAASGGGEIRMEDIGGSVRAETGGGEIAVGSVGGDLNIQTGGGRVSIGAVKGKISATTGGGDMMLVSSEQGAVLEAGGGTIHVQQCTGKLKVTTGGGNIEVGEAGGPVEIETGGGSIRLVSARGPVRAETGAGRIELNGVPAAHAETGAGAIIARFAGSNTGRTDSMLETASGDITVYFEPNLNISVRATIDLANGHNIHSDFPEIRIATEGGEWGPKSITAEGNLNGGGPALKISTTAGDVWFRRASH